MPAAIWVTALPAPPRQAAFALGADVGQPMSTPFGRANAAVAEPRRGCGAGVKQSTSNKRVQWSAGSEIRRISPVPLPRPLTRGVRR